MSRIMSVFLSLLKGESIPTTDELLIKRHMVMLYRAANNAGYIHHDLSTGKFTLNI